MNRYMYAYVLTAINTVMSHMTGGITPIDSIVTAATAGQNLDQLFRHLTIDHADSRVFDC